MTQEHTQINEEITITEEAPAVADTPASEEIVNTFLSDELRNTGNLKDFKSADDLAKSYINLQKMIGNSIRIPGEDATEEQIKEFNLKIGIPETSDGYEVTAEGMDDLVSEFKSTAHELGLTKKQAELLFNRQLERIKAQEQEIEQGARALKEKFGEGLKAKLEVAEKTLKSIAVDKKIDLKGLTTGELANNPAMVELILGVADLYNEKGAVKSDAIDESQSAMSLINTIRKDTAHPYNDKNHPQHLKAVEEVRLLYMKAYR